MKTNNIFKAIITTITTVGYGDLSCVTVPEKIYGIIIEFGGIIAYSYVVSSISNYVKSKHDQEEEYFNKYQILTRIRKKHPNLSNDLFIINQGNDTSSHFSAYFGTILYQLLSYRMSEEEMICSKSFRELDKLILQLSRTELLKVKLHEGIFNRYYTPSDGILLKDDKLCGRVHISKQFTVDNTELTSEDENLKKVLYYLGRK